MNLLPTIEFVEFCEMICRVADMRFRNSDVEARELSVKVGYVLDDLFDWIGEHKELPEDAV